MIILSPRGIFLPFVFFERDLSFSTAAERSEAAVIHFFDRNNFLLRPLTFNIQNIKNLFLFFSSTVDQVVHGYVLVLILNGFVLNDILWVKIVQEDINVYI